MDHCSRALPYLTQFATQRTPNDPIKGWYSLETDMWMVETRNGPRPAIDRDSSMLEMSTKTAIQGEADDVALELLTKTDVQQEQDDEDPPSGLRFY